MIPPVAAKLVADRTVWRVQSTIAHGFQVRVELTLLRPGNRRRNTRDAARDAFVQQFTAEEAMELGYWLLHAGRDARENNRGG